MSIFSFIARLLWSCGIWFLGYLEFAGLCHSLLLGFWLARKVVLVAIVMEIFGWLFLIVWCDVFGTREIVGVLKTRSVPCLISSFFFLEPYLIGSLYGETIIFLLFWIFLIFVMFVFDLFSLVYSRCTLVYLFFWYQWIFITYQKTKKKKLEWTNKFVVSVCEFLWCQPLFLIEGKTIYLYEQTVKS